MQGKVEVVWKNLRDFEQFLALSARIVEPKRGRTKGREAESGV
jgi:hypothetical protein